MMLSIKDKIRLLPDTQDHSLILGAWKKHSIAEDAHDIATLVTTLTEDCVYTIIGTEKQWRGREGAAAFYHELIGAFPDIKFDLQHIVVGPQGVFEEASVTLTQSGTYLGFPPTGLVRNFEIGIFFPWDREKKLFSGERIYANFKSILTEGV